MTNSKTVFGKYLLFFACLQNIFSRSLTKCPTAILRPFLESTHFFFSCLKNFFSRNLTKRPRAILRPFLESTRICLIQAPPPWRKKLSLFLPGGLILAEFFYCRTWSLFGTKKSKKYFFIKKHFFQNYFWKKYFFPILFFTAEVSHFLGQKNQKNI